MTVMRSMLFLIAIEKIASRMERGIEEPNPKKWLSLIKFHQIKTFQ